jgi:hypothetical protein
VTISPEEAIIKAGLLGCSVANFPGYMPRSSLFFFLFMEDILRKRIGCTGFNCNIYIALFSAVLSALVIISTYSSSQFVDRKINEIRLKIFHVSNGYINCFPALGCSLGGY